MSEPQYAAIKQPLGSPFPAVHCPICGNLSMDSGKVTPCPHLAFIYVEVVGKFEYQSEQFAKRYVETAGSLQESLIESDYGNTLLVLEITHGPGPARMADMFGFDYQTLVDDKE